MGRPFSALVGQKATAQVEYRKAEGDRPCFAQDSDDRVAAF
jgi:hypothetical protein